VETGGYPEKRAGTNDSTFFGDLAKVAVPNNDESSGLFQTVEVAANLAGTETTC